MTYMADGIMQWDEGSMDDYGWLDDLLLKQPATEKDFNADWQAYKYMLRGKMYAYIGILDKEKRPIITLKLDPGYSQMLRGEYPDIIPGYYMNKVHWSTVYLDGAVPQEVLEDIVLSAYETLLASLSKKAQKEIRGE